MAQEVPYITVKANNHPKDANIQNLSKSQKRLGFPVTKKPPVQEYITIPFPDFCTLSYEVIVWTQYQTQMNEVLEKIFYNYDYMDSFVMWSEYEQKTMKGDGYRFVGFRDGSVTPQTNIEEFSEQERVIKYVYSIKVPAYLILDPKDEALAYGRNKSNSKGDDNSKAVYKTQNAVEVQLKEQIVSSKIIDGINASEIDVFSDSAEQAKVDLFRLLGNMGNTGGGGGTSLIISTVAPPNIASISDAGDSSQVASANHTHGHGEQAGGSLHALVTSLSAGFVPALTGSTGDVLSIVSGQPKWLAQTGGVSSTPTSINGFSGTLTLVAGPNITINSTNGVFTVTGSASVDLSPLNLFSASLNVFTQSLNEFIASFSSSVKTVGDTRYVFTSSFDAFSGSVNTFSASIVDFSSSILSSILYNERVHRVQYLTASGVAQATANQITPSATFVVVTAGSNNLGVKMPPSPSIGDWYVLGLTGSMFGAGAAPATNRAIILWPATGDSFAGRTVNSNGPNLYTYQKYLVYCERTGSWNVGLLPGWYDGTANDFTITNILNLYAGLTSNAGNITMTAGNLVASGIPLNLQSSVSIAMTGTIKVSAGRITSDADLLLSSSTSLNTVSGNLNITGYAQYKRRVSYHTASFALTGSDSGRVFGNSGSLPVTGTLPLLSNVEDGTFYEARILTSSYLIFQTSGSDVIQAIGNRTTAGGFLRSNSTGSYMTIEKDKDRWFVTSIDGNWEIN